ncbi:MAG: carboxypeptidase-like regulatory domain-containing protein, partial [Prolixibacteraceae bacterium]|nr:carboxypeptidase-like regulatory domain-containing protein [Prolixibacteraceae bacterium]
MKLKINTKYLSYLILSFSLLFLNERIFAGSDTYTTPVKQQPIIVNGTITSATDGTLLPGLSIIVKGTSTGTITNSDGEYNINAPPDGRSEERR